MKRTLILAAVVAAGSAMAQVVTPPPVSFPPGTEMRTPTVPRKSEDASTRPDGRVATQDDMQRARAAFEEMIRAYEAGDVALFERRLAASLIGYQIFLDGVRQNVSGQRNVRIQLIDTQITAGPDLTVIETSWEKRFLDAATFQPVLQTGRSTILLSRKQNEWQLAAVSGDNLFAGGGGYLAQIVVTPESIVSPPGGCAAATCPSIRIEIIDADLATQPFIQAEILSVDGDRETIVLNRITPGRFVAPNVAVEIGAAFTPVPHNGVLTMRAAGGTQTQFVVRFLDSNPGSNRPPSLLAKNVRVQVPPGPAPAGGGAGGGGGTLATMTVTPNSVTLNFGCTGRTTAPVQLRVTDPDLAGAPSVTVVALTPNGDSETLTLPAISPGVFQVSTLSFETLPVPNDGFISASGNFATFRYIDTTAGPNAPPIVVAAILNMSSTVACSAGV